MVGTQQSEQGLGQIDPNIGFVTIRQQRNNVVQVPPCPWIQDRAPAPWTSTWIVRAA